MVVKPVLPINKIQMPGISLFCSSFYQIKKSYKLCIMKKHVSRKDFLMKCLGAAGMLVGGTVFMGSCASGNDSEAPGNAAAPPKSMVAEPGHCNDVAGVADGEVNKRQAVQYVEKSTDPARHCDLCQLYVPPAKGQTCGMCTLFKGPVAADASCISFAPRQA